MEWDNQKTTKNPFANKRGKLFYMNNIKTIDSSFHKELKFIRDALTEQVKHRDYYKVVQIISMIINPAKRPSSA